MRKSNHSGTSDSRRRSHQAAWMPAGPQQPLGQPIGGGPHPRHATLIHGTATRKTLAVTVQKLGGTVVHEVTISA